MANLQPVEHDPVAMPQAGPLLMPVDHDPFGGQPSGVTMDSDLSALDPYETIRLRSELATKGGYTPQQAAANRQQTGMDILYATPLGNALSARDALEAKWQGQELERLGDSEGARRAFAQAAASAGMSFLPGMGRIGLGRGAEGAASSTRIFAGPMAKTANHLALAQAAEMEAQGLHPDEIWRATGWGRGADGKWRFEIDDSKAAFDFSKLAPYEGPATSQIPETGLKGARVGDLGNALDHPALFEAYPHLAQARLHHLPNETQWGVRGNYYWQPDESITITGLATDPRSTGFHEIQHAVQREEGFQPGSSTSFHRDRVQNAPRAAEIFADIKAKHPNDPDAKIWTYAYSQAAFERNQRTMGETEARNVQERRDLSGVMRREHPPSQTQDVPTEAQLFINPAFVEAKWPGYLRQPQRAAAELSPLTNAFAAAMAARRMP